jgi:hypothetical protein
LAYVKPSQKFRELIGMQIPTTEEAVEELSFREAILPSSLRELRQKLGQKAKQQKRFRFDSLYGLVCRSDTLQAAWAAVRCNGGAPGVDQVSLEQITATPETEAAFLDEVQRSLREKTYPRPSGAPSVPPQGERKTAAVGHTHGAGPSGSSGGVVDLGTDLRSGL